MTSTPGLAPLSTLPESATTEMLEDTEIDMGAEVPEVIPVEEAGWGETIAVGLLGLSMSWFSLWCLFKDAAIPGGWLFSLIIVYLGGSLGGVLAEQVRVPTGEGKSVPLPGLVGMLLMGFVIRNACDEISHGSFALEKKISSSLRGLALAVILIRAGLGLSLADLRRLWGTCLAMSTIPATVEAVSGMCFACWFFGFDLKWGLMLGFILADVSPAVTVPLLLKFQEEGQGSDKGIPSILLAASSLNSVFAICCFGIVMGFNFTGSGTPVWETILRGVLDVIGGVAIGALSGWLVYKLTQRFPSSIRFALTFAFACVQIFGMKVQPFTFHTSLILTLIGTKVEPLKSTGGNALATLVMGLTIANLWDKAEYEGMQASFNMVWKSVGERMMFSLLGASMHHEDLEPDVVGAGLAIIFLGLFFRGIAAMASISSTGLP
jgi:NhaP-type Na+/H+ or K+/H+ antiporter